MVLRLFLFSCEDIRTTNPIFGSYSDLEDRRTENKLQ